MPNLASIIFCEFGSFQCIALNLDLKYDLATDVQITKLNGMHIFWALQYIFLTGNCLCCPFQRDNMEIWHNSIFKLDTNVFEGFGSSLCLQ
jgi:hypothetical protein